MIVFYYQQVEFNTILSKIIIILIQDLLDIFKELWEQDTINKIKNTHYIILKVSNNPEYFLQVFLLKNKMQFIYSGVNYMKNNKIYIINHKVI